MPHSFRALKIEILELISLKNLFFVLELLRCLILSGLRNSKSHFKLISLKSIFRRGIVVEDKGKQEKDLFNVISLSSLYSVMSSVPKH